MRTAIEAAEIGRLYKDFRNTTFPYEQEELRGKLDAIANGYYQDNECMVVADDNAERDDALTLLHNFGRITLTNSYPLAHEFPAVPQRPQYIRGMELLGLPHQDVTRLATSFQRGEIPSDVVDAVVNHQDEIRSLHPDKYPFEDTAYDVFSIGLDKAGINTERIWHGVKKNLVKRGKTDLVLIYGYETTTHALTGFLAHYALTKHNIAELDCTRQEVHF